MSRSTWNSTRGDCQCSAHYKPKFYLEFYPKDPKSHEWEQISNGKTTLLNVLAGQLAESPRLHLSGLLEVNGQSISEKAYKFAYVRQEDLFFSQLTVRETLSLAAELQLPQISSVEAKG